MECLFCGMYLEALNLIFSTVLHNRAYYPYLTDGETEAENL